MPAPLALCFLVTVTGAAIFCYNCHHAVSTLQPAKHGLNRPKPWVKISLSSFKLPVSTILFQWQESESCSADLPRKEFKPNVQIFTPYTLGGLKFNPGISCFNYHHSLLTLPLRAASGWTLHLDSLILTFRAFPFFSRNPDMHQSFLFVFNTHFLGICTVGVFPKGFSIIYRNQKFHCNFYLSF